MFTQLSRPIVEQLELSGVELDQRMQQAFARGPKDLRDSDIFLALCESNSEAARLLANHALDLGELWKHSPSLLNEPSPDYQNYGWPTLDRILTKAIERSGFPKVLGTRDFLVTLVDEIFDHGDDYTTRPWTTDILSRAFGGQVSTPLSSIPVLSSFLDRLRRTAVGSQDFQYVLTLADNRLVFAVASVVDDFVQRSESGLLVPSRALLTHFQETFGGFTGEEISGLEDLLNRNSTEADYQHFFEDNPHFFRRWEFREVHPQVILPSDPSSLKPDFILTDRELQRALVVELKLPHPKIIRRQRSRDRLAASVMEARAQLLRYRDWFRSRSNRELLKPRVGMEIYEPRLAVVIGRSAEFVDEVDRQRLSADNSDIEVVTFDDILEFARRRRIIISGGAR